MNHICKICCHPLLLTVPSELKKKQTHTFMMPILNGRISLFLVDSSIKVWTSTEINEKAVYSVHSFSSNRKKRNELWVIFMNKVKLSCAHVLEFEVMISVGGQASAQLYGLWGKFQICASFFLDTVSAFERLERENNTTLVHLLIENALNFVSVFSCGRPRNDRDVATRQDKNRTT